MFETRPSSQCASWSVPKKLLELSLQLTLAPSVQADKWWIICGRYMQLTSTFLSGLWWKRFDTKRWANSWKIETFRGLSSRLGACSKSLLHAIKEGKTKEELLEIARANLGKTINSRLRHKLCSKFVSYGHVSHFRGKSWTWCLRSTICSFWCWSA